jgi:hypothetical protein
VNGPGRLGRWSLAFAVSVYCLASEPPAALAGGDTVAVTLQYTTNVADERFITQLAVAADGNATLMVGSNRLERNRPIGRFEAPLPDGMARRLEAVATGRPLLGAPSQPSLIPDEVFREIRVTPPGDGPAVKLVGEQLLTPEPFAQAEAEIARVIEHVQRHAVIGVSMEMAQLPSELRVGQSMVIDVALRNVGRVPFRFETPTAWGQRGTQAELSALRSDIPEMDLRSEHQRFVQIGGATLVRTEPPVAEPLPLLMPGERQYARFQCPLDWPPGRYGVELSLTMTLFDEKNRPAFTGGLVGTRQYVTLLPAAER